MHTSKHVFDRVWDAVGDLVNTRTLLAVLALSGFWVVAWRVLDLLSDPDPAELFTVLNLALVPVSSALSYWFGFEQGSKKQTPVEPEPPAAQ